MARVELAAGGLLLCPYEDGDIDWVCRACQDPEIHRWLPLPCPYTEADALAHVR